MSRPMLSQPSQWAADGPASGRQVADGVFGSCSPMKPAKTASTIMRTTQPVATQKPHPSLPHRDRPPGAGCRSTGPEADSVSSISPPSMPEPGSSNTGGGSAPSCEGAGGSRCAGTTSPRVDDGVQDVDEQVDDDVGDGDDDRDDLHDRVVLGLHAVRQQAAE